MDKVKITREQADNLEKTRLIYNDIAIVDLKMAHGDDYGSIKNIDADTLIRALYIGYEVEETPEDKVRTTFEYVLEQIDKHDGGHGDEIKAEHFKGMKTGIITTLATLNIKIVGVNHD